MSIFNILSFIGGLALFLYGMQAMGDALERRAGGKLRGVLEKLTSNKWKAVLLGAAVTAVIQSSSATTVMVVGLVNSGVMRLSQSVGIIMGANIGTTVTAWLLSLTGIDSTNIFVQLLKPSSFTPILAAIGIVMYLFSKKERVKDTGAILLGFSVLMFGMITMGNAVEPLADVPEFTSILTLFSNPVLGVLIGVVFTALIQSSSASVGILQALSLTGSVSFATAIPIMMGQNIGTCITALMSSIGTNRNARRAALVHLYFNVIGTLVCMGLFYGANAIFHFAFLSSYCDPASIAVCYSTLSIVRTAILLPFSSQLERLACLSIRDTDGKSEPVFLDKRLLDTPPIAVERSRQLTTEMALLAKKTLTSSLTLFEQYNSSTAGDIAEQETELDSYEDKIGSFLMELSGKSISEEDTHRVAELLHAIGDFERIGDHSLNLLEAAEEMRNKELTFSPTAQQQLEVLFDAVREIIDLAITSFVNDDTAMASRVEPLEEVVDILRVQLKTEHVRRLQEGECTIGHGFVFSDILTNLERVADHCSNIAGCVIQERSNTTNMHEYMAAVKDPTNPDFARQYNMYMDKYDLSKLEK